jgi:MoxR-like ATPase
MPEPRAMTVEEAKAAAARFKADYGAVREQIARVVVGQDAIIDGALTCLFVGGHCLLEGVPGIGKTLLIRTLARAVNPELFADPVHTRPDAGGHLRDDSGGGDR